IQPPEKVVLGVAPTGAVAIAMGNTGHTIQSVFPAFRTCHKQSSKWGNTQNASQNTESPETQMMLSPNRLSKLCAILWFDAAIGTARVQLLIIEEISMVGAALFGAIHCRLCEALENPDTRNFKRAFCDLDLVVIGDFNQLDPVCATSLVTEVTKVDGFNTIGMSWHIPTFPFAILYFV
ncbi:MAG: hypothetical protein ACO3YZ_07830, partial [Candidatus Nanopelagicaceae bacterium]